ncbi:MAG: hypothetical protein WC838_03930 [Candidatus Margulisiibacteriota bacterium]|jgi:hypothetical protein
MFFTKVISYQDIPPVNGLPRISELKVAFPGNGLTAKLLPQENSLRIVGIYTGAQKFHLLLATDNCRNMDHLQLKINAENQSRHCAGFILLINEELSDPLNYRFSLGFIKPDPAIKDELIDFTSDKNIKRLSIVMAPTEKVVKEFIDYTLTFIFLPDPQGL